MYFRIFKAFSLLQGICELLCLSLGAQFDCRCAHDIWVPVEEARVFLLHGWHFMDVCIVLLGPLSGEGSRKVSLGPKAKHDGSRPFGLGHLPQVRRRFFAAST